MALWSDLRECVKVALYETTLLNIYSLQRDQLHFTDWTEALEMRIQCTHSLSMSLIRCFHSFNNLHSFLPPMQLMYTCNSANLSDWLSPQPKSHAWKCINKVLLSENISDVISKLKICIISIHLKLFTYDSHIKLHTVIRVDTYQNVYVTLT